jgi:NADP-dependent aldehyde dehydrogenase
LPEKLSSDHAALATQLGGSVCQSVGQFCTNPGLIIAIDSESSRTFTDELVASFKKQTSDTMLNDGIYANYEAMKSEMISKEGVSVLHEHSKSDKLNAAQPTLASVSAKVLMSDRTLQEEVFGPFTMLVICEDADQMEQVASSLQGQLTASLMAALSDLDQNSDLIDILETKVGRLILNGVPTGLEVSAAMHHGGPWPASSDSRFTSVGTAAVYRFVRWVCWQGW